MSVLSNPRHERFAQERAKGQTVDAAYVEAGFKANRGNAARLNANESIQRRIAELQRGGAVRAEVTVERVVRELAAIGFADIRKAVMWRANVTGMVEDDDGTQRMAVTNEVCLIDSDKLDDVTALAVAEISQTDKGGLRIKLHDKLGALTQMGRHLGMFTDRQELSGPEGGPLMLGVDRPPEETRDQWLERRQRELAAPKT